MSRPRLVSMGEVLRHASDDDCWLVIDSRVWDVTAFAPDHPGGADVILRYAGRDATAAYNQVHSPATIQTLPLTQLVGRVDDSWRNKSKSSPQTRTRTPAKPPLNAILSAYDFEDAARHSLSKKAWAFYSSAATDLISHSSNQSFYRRIWMRPRLLRNVRTSNTRRTVLGVSLTLPIVVAPVALARLAHPCGEKGIAGAAAKKGVGYCIPITASFPAEEIIASVPPPAVHPFFFQLYVNKDRASSEAVLRRVWDLGVRTLFVTIDTPVPGKREADERVRTEEAISMPMTGTQASQDVKGSGITRTTGTFIDDTLSWDDLAWLRTHWGGKLVLKGVQSAEDALMAVDAEVDGIVLSNHGGRNLDTAPPALLTLLELHRHCPSVLHQTEVLVDGGIRRGTDILKAICLGASAVLIGRPVMYALNYGQDGVEHLVDILTAELQAAMKLVGITDLSQAHRGLVNTQDLEHLVVRELTAIGSAPRAKI